MSYPSMPREVLLKHLEDLRSGNVVDLSARAVQAGEGSPIDMSALDACVADIKRALDEWRAEAEEDRLDVDRFEGAMAERLHRCLAEFDVAILDDPSFWVYLASGPLWFFVRWREDPDERKSETYHLYVDGAKNDTCVPLRMFLRAQAVLQGGDYGPVSSIHGGTDFWRSHVLRVRMSSKPELARAFAERQTVDRLATNLVREYAKRINRRWSNEVLYLLDIEECRVVADEERP